jgi:predicted DNA-binding transcriptional regulator YafY
VKIAAVLPNELRRDLETTALLVGPSSKPKNSVMSASDDASLVQIRRAIRGELKLNVTYRDAKGKDSQRVIWPFAVGFFDQVCMVAAWCEQRAEYRHFRTDRIQSLTVSKQTYPKRRLAMLKEWKAREGVRS